MKVKCMKVKVCLYYHSEGENEHRQGIKDQLAQPFYKAFFKLSVLFKELQLFFSSSGTTVGYTYPSPCVPNLNSPPKLPLVPLIKKKRVII